MLTGSRPSRKSEPDKPKRRSGQQPNIRCQRHRYLACGFHRLKTGATPACTTNVRFLRTPRKFPCRMFATHVRSLGCGRSPRCATGWDVEATDPTRCSAYHTVSQLLGCAIKSLRHPRPSPRLRGDAGGVTLLAAMRANPVDQIITSPTRGDATCAEYCLYVVEEGANSRVG